MALAAVSLSPAAAATSQPYTEFSNIFGSGGAVTAVRVPILLASGKVIYKDVTITISSDSLGNLTYATAIPGQVLSAPLDTANITAGTYLSAVNTAYGWQITGPSALGTGVGKWEITGVVGVYGWCGGPATFYSGALTAIPIAARLKAAKITDTEYSYGVVGYGAYCGAQWATGRLICVSQTGTKVEVAPFTTPAGIDQSTPYDRVELSLK